MELAQKHNDKAKELIEAAAVHYMIEKVLREGLEAQDKYEYEQESLSNLAQSLTN